MCPRDTQQAVPADRELFDPQADCWLYNREMHIIIGDRRTQRIKQASRKEEHADSNDCQRTLPLAARGGNN